MGKKALKKFEEPKKGMWFKRLSSVQYLKRPVVVIAESAKSYEINYSDRDGKLLRRCVLKDTVEVEK